MKIYYDIIQGTPEWHEVRKLKLTASNGTAIGNAGSGLGTYVNKLVANAISPEPDRYVSDAMKRGTELEPLARLKYKYESNIPFIEVGFIDYNDYIGVSPDAIYMEKKIIVGGLELKCRNTEKHLAILQTGVIESATLWQMQMAMKITGAKWWDFGSYNPNFKKSLYIKRIEPDPVKFAKLEKGFIVGESLLKEKLNDPIVQFELKNG